MSAASPESALRLFERAAAVGGQLLRVERMGATGDGDRASAFVFTFDIGRIGVSAEAGALRGDHLVSREDLPSGAVDAAEEEPWWRLLGHPLTRVEAAAGGALDLRFRHDADSPRTVRLAVDGARVRATLLP